MKSTAAADFRITDRIEAQTLHIFPANIYTGYLYCPRNANKLERWHEFLEIPEKFLIGRVDPGPSVYILCSGSRATGEMLSMPVKIWGSQERILQCRRYHTAVWNLDRLLCHRGL